MTWPGKWKKHNFLLKGKPDLSSPHLARVGTFSPPIWVSRISALTQYDWYKDRLRGERARRPPPEANMFEGEL